MAANFSTHVVNLTRRPDRRLSMQQLLENYNIDATFIKAYDGKELEPSLELTFGFMGNDFGSKRAVIGCALSHFKLWLQLAAHNESDDPLPYLILEDDVTFNFEKETAVETINSIIQKSQLGSYLDCIYLGHTTISNKPQTPEAVTKSNWHLEALNEHCRGATYAYLLTQIGARKLVKLVQDHGIRHGIDYFMMKAPLLKMAAIYPQAIVSEWVKVADNGGNGGDSDIVTDGSTINICEGWNFCPGVSIAPESIFLKLVPNQTLNNSAWFLYNHNIAFDMADLARMAIKMDADAFSTDGALSFELGKNNLLPLQTSTSIPYPHHSFWFKSHGTFIKVKNIKTSDDFVISSLIQTHHTNPSYKPS